MPSSSVALIVAVCVLTLFVKWRWLSRAPVSVLRIVGWLLTHTVYRLRVLRREQIPSQGGVLLVSNHASYIDWWMLQLACPRPVRFLLLESFHRHWLIGPFARWLRTIPIDPNNLSSVRRAMAQTVECLKQGEVVCVFPEGGLTRSGLLRPFGRGFSKLAQDADVPIVPVYLDNFWGSVFSYAGGRLLASWPKQLPRHLQIIFGRPLPPTTTPQQAMQAIQELSAESALAGQAWVVPVHRAFIRRAKRQLFRPAFVDTSKTPSPTLNYLKALVGVLCLRQQLARRLPDPPAVPVGLWLPPSVGGALANIALACLGRVTVNLNYTAGAENIRSAIRQAGIRRVLTSQRFVQRMPFPESALAGAEPVEVIYLEDLASNIGTRQRLGALLRVLLLPTQCLEWSLGLQRHRLDDIATIIFSSGSTGEPKGVVLSHRNIAANLASVLPIVDIRPTDRMLGFLPIFHSFGYTVTIWAVLCAGACAVYWPDPRQAREVGELCRTHRVTVLLATATFLRLFMRRCQADDFASVRLMICGAEKLPVVTAEEFATRFGVLPMEGYGCTELAPVVGTNLPNTTVAGYMQITNRPGTIGMPMPGIVARIVDPESGQPLPLGEQGLIQIKGANVMVGYLNRPDLTAKAIHDGWYNTGDMGLLDEHGHLKITGRLARFAKISGEMVPLERIEEEMNALCGTGERHFAVASVPDPLRGERIIVLYCALPEGVSVAGVIARLSERGLPNLWLPDERSCYPVAELPTLASGKLDLQAVKRLAERQCLGESAA